MFLFSLLRNLQKSKRNFHKERNLQHLRCFSYQFNAYKDRNLYQVLQVNKNSSKQDIKKAYFNLAKKYHPYSNEKFFKQLHMANSILSDDILREQYDKYYSASYNQSHYNENNNTDSDYNNSNFNRRQYKQQYTGHEWFWVSANTLIFWAMICTITNNYYDDWHVKQFKNLRVMMSIKWQYYKASKTSNKIQHISGKDEELHLARTVLMVPFYLLLFPFYVYKYIMKIFLEIVLNPKLELVQIQMCNTMKFQQQASKVTKQLNHNEQIDK